MDKRTWKIRCAAFCSSLAACALLPAAFALLEKEDPAPAVTTFSKVEDAGKTVTFSQEDFTTRLTGEDTLEGIVVSALPDTAAGTLLLGGQPLSQGESVSLDGLSALSFEPAGESDTQASFSFLPVFTGYGAGEESVQVNINLSDTPNSAPIATSLSFETYVDLPLTGQLEASDAEGDALSFAIMEKPQKGTAEVTESGAFRYTPKEGKSYEESFTYYVTDAQGNSSNPAQVKVTVKKQEEKETIRYADLEDDPAHYAAIKLTEAGVFSGEQIGTDYFLDPEETVTRAQFIAMAMAASDIPLPSMAVPSGLADDAQTPDWAKAASAAALASGVVEGSPDGSGSKVLRPNEPITRAEAVAILDRALDVPAGVNLPMDLKDAAQVPQWAAQAVQDALQAGILQTTDGNARPNDNLTRSEAVQMVYKAMDLGDEEEKSFWDFLR